MKIVHLEKTGTRLYGHLISGLLQRTHNPVSLTIRMESVAWSV